MSDHHSSVRRPLIPGYARLPLFLCLVTDLIAYYLPRILNVDAKLDFSIGLDAIIPVIPAFSYIYVAAFAFWTVNYVLIARQSRVLCMRLFCADTVAKAVCLLCFLFLPSHIDLGATDQITGTGAWLLRLVYALDEPNNLLPSIHCFVSYLAFRPMLSRDAWGIPAGYKVFSAIFALLICLSTLFTHQHVVLDAVTGIAVAECGWQLAKLLPAREV